LTKTYYMCILFMHCCFTQEDRRAFKAIQAENIYASLSEVRTDTKMCPFVIIVGEQDWAFFVSC